MGISQSKAPGQKGQQQTGQMRRVDSWMREAAIDGDRSRVSTLLAEGGDPNMSYFGGKTLLHLASCYGHLPVVQELLQYGGDIRSKDNQGSTPLHLAACYNHLDVVREMLELRANVDESDKQGQTPLHLAACYRHLGILRELLERQANTDALDNDGHSPLQLARTRCHNIRIEELLVKEAQKQRKEEDEVWRAEAQFARAKGEAAPAPGHWSSSGEPVLQEELRPGSREFEAVRRYFLSGPEGQESMPSDTKVTRIVRAENKSLWNPYFDYRQTVLGEVRGGKAIPEPGALEEVWLFHGSPTALQQESAEGLRAAFEGKVFKRWGYGGYFARDPRLSHLFAEGPRLYGRKDPRGRALPGDGVFRVGLWRVAAGRTRTKDPVGPPELDDIILNMPPEAARLNGRRWRDFNQEDQDLWWSVKLSTPEHANPGQDKQKNLRDFYLLVWILVLVWRL